MRQKEEEDTVFSDVKVAALVLHCRLDSFSALKEKVEETKGIRIVYQKVSDDPLYISSEDPRGDGCG